MSAKSACGKVIRFALMKTRQKMNLQMCQGKTTQLKKKLRENLSSQDQKDFITFGSALGTFGMKGSVRLESVNNAERTYATNVTVAGKDAKMKQASAQSKMKIHMNKNQE